MNILAIDTSGECCSLAYSSVGNNTLTFHNHSPKGQSAVIIDGIKGLLEADGGSNFSEKLKEVDYVIFGAGPGSFTGVRLAASVAKSLAFMQPKAKCYGVSCLQSIALEAHQKSGFAKVAVVQDARKSEVYVGAYDFSNFPVLNVIMADSVLAPDSLAGLEECCVVGSGIGLLSSQADRFKSHYDGCEVVNAEHLIKLAQAYIESDMHDLFYTAPSYIRNNVAY